MKFSTIATSVILVLSCVAESHAANTLKLGRYGAMSSEGNKIKNSNDDECWIRPDAQLSNVIVNGDTPQSDTKWCSWGINVGQSIQRVIANGNELTVFIGDPHTAKPYHVNCDGDGALWQFTVDSGYVDSKEIHKDKDGHWVYGDNSLVDYSYNNGIWSLTINNNPMRGYDMPNINLACTYPILV